MVEVALFDLDDTLVGRTEAFLEWWGDEARRLGVDADTIHEVADIRGGDYRLVREFFVEIADHIALRGDVESWYQGFRAAYPRYVRVTPSTTAALKRLRANGWRIGIVTNGITVEQTAKIELTGLDVLVDGWAISQAEDANKPAPAIFAACAARIGVDLDSGGWMVGDSLDADIAGGNALGLTTVWIRHGRFLIDGDPVPDHTVDDVAEAVDLMLGADGA
ncbi:HAD family hydrolase [Stackebrandtia soli]|uniref:HAD family hydrolase n=1 Tax=Stackebrandtia soli TaxID=1892856 RepID=UPI0039E8FAAA